MYQSRYALQGFSDSLRLELSQKGVHVSTVHPGVIRSDFRQRAQWRGEGNQRQKMMDNLLEAELEGSDEWSTCKKFNFKEKIIVNQSNKSMCTWGSWEWFDWLVIDYLVAGKECVKRVVGYLKYCSYSITMGSYLRKHIVVECCWDGFVCSTGYCTWDRGITRNAVTSNGWRN